MARYYASVYVVIRSILLHALGALPMEHLTTAACKGWKVGKLGERTGNIRFSVRGSEYVSGDEG